MKQRIAAILIGLAAVCAAHAHFIFAVPEPGGATAKVFLSETLEPSGVGTDLAGRAKLVLRDAHGAETPLDLHLVDDYYLTALPAGAGVVHGTADLGVMDRGSAHRLLYYPKTILGDAFSSNTKVGDSAVVEIVPHGRPGALELEVLAHGKPQADSEVTVIFPDGTSKVLETDAKGMTETLTAKGRYGAWARYWEDEGGELDGKKYEQTRHYAMLVFDAPAPAGASDAEASASSAKKLTPMPEAASSFGSTVAGDWLYVYGGHISPTHNYSTEAVSGNFHRLPLSGKGSWEELPAGPGLQGMNIAAHEGMVYRVGGMAPLNAPGEPTDNRSVADVARFDPKSNKWEALPSLPEPRSSHDVVVLGDKLFVLGGWTMKEGGEQDWPNTSLVMDLSASKPSWKTIEQPFQRRAFMAAAYKGKIYFVGGFNSKNEVKRTVSIYDPASGSWSEGPELPDLGRTTGFAPAAGVHRDHLYVSIGEGSLLRLSANGEEWETVGKTTPRLAHRLASNGESVLILGGASGGQNFDLVEAVSIDR